MLTRYAKTSLLTAALLMTAAVLPGSAQRSAGDEPAPAASSGAAPQASSAAWAAVAPGRVEPRSREIKIAAPLPARIAEVLVKANDEVFAGELLVRLDDEEALARLAAADAQVAVRSPEPDEQLVMLRRVGRVPDQHNAAGVKVGRPILRLERRLRRQADEPDFVVSFPVWWRLAGAQ